MILWLEAYKKPWIWVLIHIFLGYVSTFTNIVVIVYFYLFLISSIFIVNKQSQTLLPLLIAYLIPFEIICRMAQTSPYIPYELSKYLLFILLGYGILKGNHRGRVGFFMLFLLLPALFYDYSNEVVFKGFVFNILAPINLCLGIIYFYKQTKSSDQIKKILIAIVLPLVSALVFTYIRTPDYDQIDFQLGANFETTGGFGSNQVSTVFGLGMLLTFYLWYKQISISGYRYGDAVILFLFVLQGLLSFSRGGMIGGALGILIVLFYEGNKSTPSSRKKPNMVNYFVPSILLVLSSIWIANEITDGKLLLRYMGETAGTLAGTKEKSLNTITTNRASIFEGDWALFSEYNFGVGAGASRYLRESDNGILSHVEFSRLVAEHGYLGFLFFLLFTFLPLFYFAKKYVSKYKGIMVALFFVAWYTTFHAATRNFVTPLLAGISLIYVRHDKSTSLRK